MTDNKQNGVLIFDSEPKEISVRVGDDEVVTYKGYVADINGETFGGMVIQGMTDTGSGPEPRTYLALVDVYDGGIFELKAVPETFLKAMMLAHGGEAAFYQDLFDHMSRTMSADDVAYLKGTRIHNGVDQRVETPATVGDQTSKG